MPDRSQRKHRKEQKRKQTQLARRRAASVSPFKRIAHVGKIEACYITSGWEEEGIASITFIRDTPEGTAMAIFLVDRWCIGLKDAYGWLDLTRSEIDAQMKLTGGSVSLTRVDPEGARRLIASAIRFSKLHQFKLPKHLDRWIAIAGGVGEIESADISSFGHDGKLHYVGHPHDLAKRLTTCTFEEFIARPDVWVEFPDYFDPLFDPDEPDAADEWDGSNDVLDPLDFEDLPERMQLLLQETPAQLLPELRAHLAQRGEAAHPRLQDGIRLALALTMSGFLADDLQGEDPHDEQGARASAIVAGTLTDLLGGVNNPIPDDLKAAAQQAAGLLEELAPPDGLLGQTPPQIPRRD